MARLSIDLIAAPVIVAPAGVWFEAIGTDGLDVAADPAEGDVYDPGFHNVSYSWHIQGDPLPAFTAPGNMVPEWRDANRAYGRQVVFFFPIPGRYTIELIARGQSGTTAVARREVVVEDPDKVYRGALTICVSSDPQETWTKAPDGCQKVSTAAALSRAIAKAPSPARILFKRGQTFSGVSLRIRGRKLGLIDAWGDGAPPVLRSGLNEAQTWFRFEKDANSGQVTFANLDFYGLWDSTTERGFSVSAPISWGRPSTPGHYAIWSCRFDGFSKVDVAINKSVPGIILLGNSVITNWRDYGIQFRNSEARLGLVGTQIAQHQHALHGGPKVGSAFNNHGPVRISDARRVYIGASDFFSRSGWSGLSGERADQPCLRLNSSGAGGRVFNLDRIVCEGGFRVISLSGANDRRLENPGNYVIDKALLIGTAKTIGPFIEADFGGITIRNMLAVLPDSPRRHPNRWMGVVRNGVDNPGPGNTEAPFSVYSSTTLNLLSQENSSDRAWDFYVEEQGFDTTTLENNLLHKPEHSAGFDLTAALKGIHPRFQGIRYGFPEKRGELRFAVPPGKSFSLNYDEITTDRMFTKGGGPTSQAYWQKTEKIDRMHTMIVKGSKKQFYTWTGTFAVRFAAEAIVITNRSAETWREGATWILKLDRASRLSPADTHFASPARLPLPRPSSVHRASAGKIAWDDFYGRPRGAEPSQGAFEPD